MQSKQIVSGISQMLGPLLLKSIILFAEERSAARASAGPLPNVGMGIVMAFVLLFLTIVSNIGANQVRPTCAQFSCLLTAAMSSSTGTPW